MSSAQAALLAVGAAALWAAGTVLGRAASTELRFADITALRFRVGLLTLLALSLATRTSLAIGLDAAPNLVLLALSGATRTSLAIGLDAAPNLVLLALVPGLLALLLYSRALGRTPASRATLAELAFPLTAAVVGVTALGATLAGSQWLGLVVVLLSVVGLAVHEQRSRRPSVPVPDRADEALAAAPASSS